MLCSSAFWGENAAGFLGILGPLFPGLVFLLSSFLLLLPPLFCWGRPGFLFSSSLCVPAGPPRSTKEGPALHVACCPSFFLSARAGSPLPPSLLSLFLSSSSLSLSLLSLSFFFLSLACKRMRLTDCWVTSGKCSAMGIDIVIATCRRGSPSRHVSSACAGYVSTLLTTPPVAPTDRVFR